MSTQLIDLESGSTLTGDSGERADADAIKPIDAGERVQAAVIDRPFENLRARTEELRKKVEELLYRADADKWIITGGNTIGAVSGPTAAFPTVSWNATTGIFTVSEAIVVQPFVSPNTDIFALQQYTFDATDTFIFEANDDPLAGDILYDYQLANSIRIIWETRALGVGVFCVATLEGSPNHILRIVIRNDSTTLASHVETELNTILGPAIPASPLKFSLGGPGTTVLDLADIAGDEDVVLTGTYSRELHHIAQAAVASFFAIPANTLVDDGDGIGIWYEELIDSNAAERGGRRQATPTTADDGTGLPPSTEVPWTKLFRFSLEPNKIPGCIPLCRRIGTYLVFIDGTVVEHAHTATFGGEGAIDDLLARYNAHVGATGERHTAADIDFDDTNFNASWGLNPTEVQEAVDLVVGALVEEGAGISGASRVHNEAIDTGSAHSETSVAGDLHGQIDDAVGWIGERAHKTKPELITGNWQRSFPALSRDYQQNIDLSTRLDLSCHGGAWGSTVDYSKIARKYHLTGSDIYWGNPKSACNAYTLIPQTEPIIAQCVCNLPLSVTYLTESGMLSRVLVSLSGHASVPKIYISDPLNEFVLTAVNLVPYLPAGTWTGTALCAITDTRIAAMFTNGTDHIVQAWDITDGVTISFSVVSGWGTGVTLPGTGASVWKADAIIADTGGVLLYTLNSWDASDQGHLISCINITTHTVTSSGIGDSPSSSSVYPTGGLMCDTSNVYFTTMNYSTNVARLCSALKLNLAIGVGGVLPLSLGNSLDEVCCSLAFDGANIYAPIKTPSAASAAIVVYDVVDKTSAGIIDLNFGTADAYLTGVLKNCCFDGVNLWVQEVSSAQLFLWAIDVGSIDSASGSVWRDISARKFAMLRYSEINAPVNGVTYAELGPLTHDGSSIFTALESVDTSTLSGEMRRLTRSCYR